MTHIYLKPLDKSIIGKDVETEIYFAISLTSTYFLTTSITIGLAEDFEMRRPSVNKIESSNWCVVWIISFQNVEISSYYLM